MKKNENSKNIEENSRLDDLNNRRYEDSVRRISKVIDYINTCRFYSDKFDNEKLHKIAKVVNILEKVVEEMNWHCEWFSYDNSVCYQIDDACSDLGTAMAEFYKDEENKDYVIVDTSLEEAHSKLSKALATLVRWNDDCNENDA